MSRPHMQIVTEKNPVSWRIFSLTQLSYFVHKKREFNINKLSHLIVCDKNLCCWSEEKTSPLWEIIRHFFSQTNSFLVLIDTHKNDFAEKCKFFNHFNVVLLWRYSWILFMKHVFIFEIANLQFRTLKLQSTSLFTVSGEFLVLCCCEHVQGWWLESRKR